MAEEVYKSNLETETEMSEKLVLIDGHSILNRAFFGIPDLTNHVQDTGGGAARLPDGCVRRV